MKVHENKNNFQNEQQIGWKTSPVTKTLLTSVTKTPGAIDERTKRILKQLREWGNNIPCICRNLVVEKGAIAYQ